MKKKSSLPKTFKPISAACLAKEERKEADMRRLDPALAEQVYGPAKKEGCPSDSKGAHCRPLLPRGGNSPR